jgi:hypothetical protein
MSDVRHTKIVSEKGRRVGEVAPSSLPFYLASDIIDDASWGFKQFIQINILFNAIKKSMASI